VGVNSVPGVNNAPLTESFAHPLKSQKTVRVAVSEVFVLVPPLALNITLYPLSVLLFLVIAEAKIIGDYVPVVLS